MDSFRVGGGTSFRPPIRSLKSMSRPWPGARETVTYYQEYLMTEDIEIEGVLETLDVLAGEYRMGIVTTSKPPDFALIHERRSILDHMEFHLTREDYERAKPHPEPYLKGLQRFGADRRRNGGRRRLGQGVEVGTSGGHRLHRGRERVHRSSRSVQGNCQGRYV